MRAPWVVVLVIVSVGTGCGSSAVGDLGDGGPGSTSPDARPVVLPPRAPGGYVVSGNQILDGQDAPHLFHGVDRPSLEWNPMGEMLSASDYQLMGSWKANVVRISLDQDYWLATASLYNSAYLATVDQQISWAHAAGMDVILELQWSDAGNLGDGSPAQQPMPDVNSLEFWTEVATRYQGDGRVLFELYSEPYGVSWDVWQNGGDSGTGFTAVGMQDLADTIRGTGADNLILIGGLDYAFDLSGVPAHRIDGYNLVYATHPYDYADKDPGSWDASWGFLTATDAVMVTEFGDFNCQPDYYQELITYADAHAASWSAWAWYVNGCGFPSIISDWNGTASAAGVPVQTALQGY